jgi:hypothetical protein
MIPTFYALSRIAETGSKYSTIAVAVERFVTLSLPHRAISNSLYEKARYFIIFIALFATLYNLPRFGELTWKSKYSSQANKTGITSNGEYFLDITELRRNPIYGSVYYSAGYLIFMCLVPFCCLSVLNILIYRKVRAVRKSTLECAAISGKERKDIRLSIMLMVIVLVFLICNTPELVWIILMVFGQANEKVTQLSNVLLVSNSAVNFIIYCIFGSRFREIFCKVFCCSSNSKFLLSKIS